MATATLDLIRKLAEAVKTPRLRTMREFAEQEIILPSGPFEGRRFACERNPFARLWFDAVESGKWRRFVATGPSQTGKSFLCFVLPILYHLFEKRETVICGVPSLDMISDKWNGDLLPVINASRYKTMLPSRGSGSKGGNVEARIQFANGAALRFMTGGGNDKTRAGATSRIVAITETDGMDTSGGTSREADKISQLEARAKSYGDRACVFMECTVSIEEGRTWQELTQGTNSRIVIRCQKCKQYVTPEREHLVGWREAENVMEAGAKARFCCPACGELWDESDRIAANQDCKLVHRGQEVTPAGEIVGTPAETNTLGFRWTATNNLLASTAVLGQDEWKASRSADEENADKAQRQFVWALPHKAGKEDVSGLTTQTIARRVNSNPRGRVPTGAHFITVGIDLGKWMCHWTAIAWAPHATGFIIDYSTIDVPSRDMAIEDAILGALREFRDTTLAMGFPADSGMMKPSLVLVDSGYFPDSAFKFCEEGPSRFAPTKGIGATQSASRKAKRDTGSVVEWVSEHCCGVRIPTRPVLEIEVEADPWKTWLHARWATPMDKPGALTLYEGTDHLGFAKHQTSEKKEQEFIAGKGLMDKWTQVHRNNHYFDSTALACVAGHLAGARLFETPKPPPPDPRQQRPQRNDMPTPSEWLNR
jgi:phage terminase large subunit GpA-like protein